ncbi:MAG: hypothetical protein HDQ88_04915 [Clostridia bacterium]|nr:hypothetical protein [Clostridia bacterium]
MKTIANFERLRTIKVGKIVKISPINKVVQCCNVDYVDDISNLDNSFRCYKHCALYDKVNYQCIRDKNNFIALDACVMSERPDKISVYFKEIENEENKDN